MIGATEYRDVFRPGDRQAIGSLVIHYGEHARGETMRIHLVADTGTVEVYGITGGQPGWTETYGWLHRGPWIQDFERFVAERRVEIERQKAIENGLAEKAKQDEARQIQSILSSYVPHYSEGGAP